MDSHARLVVAMTLAVVAGCSGGTTNIHSSESQHGFARSPITSLGDSVAALADAAISGKPLPTTPFAIDKRKDQAMRVRYDDGNRPVQPIRWLWFGIEVEFTTSHVNRRFSHFTQIFLLTETRLSILDARFTAFRPQSGDAITTARPGLPITAAPRALHETVAYLQHHGQRGQLSRLQLRNSDVGNLPDKIAKRFLRKANQDTPRFQHFAEALRHKRPAETMMIRGLGVLGRDRTGQLILVDLKVRDSASQHAKTFMLRPKIGITVVKQADQ